MHSGTPISNSVVEMYTMQRYLQYETLVKKGLQNFDCWASTFGETTTSLEIAPEGNGYRSRTRFAKFHNLPELINMFRDVADIQTADMLDLPLPKAVYSTVVVKPSEIQQEMVKCLSERAAAIHAGNVDPSVDNMLKVCSDGRKIGLDQRLMNPLLPDFEDSKVNACLENMLSVWRNTADRRLTQICFSDFSTPNHDRKFNIYDDLKLKLIARGVPEREIAFVHDADTEIKKKELFAKVRSGSVRILFGSTAKLGAGTNIQDRLIMLHDLDAPWRPADLMQRSGRIVRQGNQNPEVYIARYVTESTLDAYLYQTLEAKQKFISQIMTSKSPARTCEDLDETVLSFAEIKALCAGNPLIKQKIDLDIEVSRLRVLKADYQTQHYKLEDNLLAHYPEAIRGATENIAGYETDVKRVEASKPVLKDGFPPMEIMGTVYTEKAAAGAALLEARKYAKGWEPVEVGHYRGFALSMRYGAIGNTLQLDIKGSMRHSIELGGDIHGNLTRINNCMDDIGKKLISERDRLDNLYSQVEKAKEELAAPFVFEVELAEKSARLALLDAQLDIGNLHGTDGLMVDDDNNGPDGYDYLPKVAENDHPDKKTSVREQLREYSQEIKNAREGHIITKGTLARDVQKRDDIEI